MEERGGGRREEGVVVVCLRRTETGGKRRFFFFFGFWKFWTDGVFGCGNVSVVGSEKKMWKEWELCTIVV